MSEIPLQIKLSPSQNYAFQYVDKILCDMESISNEETDINIDDIEENVVSYLSFEYEVAYYWMYL